MISANHYVLAVSDVQVTARFFVDVMGFAIVNEPPGWIFVKQDNCMIMLGECPDAIPPAMLGDHSYFGYFVVDDADAYLKALKSRGLKTDVQAEDKPWGMREFPITTPDGHRLMVGQISQS